MERKVLPWRPALAGCDGNDSSTPARDAHSRRVASVLAAVVLITAGCAQPEEPTPPDPAASRESYEEALQRLDLDDTTAGAAWLSAGRDALSRDVAAPLPFAERFHFDSTEVHAGAVAFHAMRGQRIDLTVTGSTTRFFLDVHYLGEGLPHERDTDGQPRLVAEMARGDERLSVEPSRHGYYLLRFQPELLRGGSFTIEAAVDAVYEWPVEGTDRFDIWSVFGDSRDGGRRVHHGVDIFAPRGTPVLAVGPSEVARVSERDLGGNVVTLVDEERGLYLYYAHLDRQLTEAGRRVNAGDVIGTMGNTGNARTTPPHLHIGIYDGSFRQPLDPWYFFVPPSRTEPAEDPAGWTIARSEEGVLSLGEWVRVVRGPVAPVANPPGRSAIVPSPAMVDGRGSPLSVAAQPVIEIGAGAERDVVLPPDAPVRLIGARGEWAQIRTPDGVTGYVPAENLGPNGTPLETVVLPRAEMVRSAPRESADVLDELPAETSVALHGRYGSFGLVLMEEERGGWVRLSEG